MSKNKKTFTNVSVSAYVGNGTNGHWDVTGFRQKGHFPETEWDMKITFTRKVREAVSEAHVGDKLYWFDSNADAGAYVGRGDDTVYTVSAVTADKFEITWENTFSAKPGYGWVKDHNLWYTKANGLRFFTKEPPRVLGS